MSSQYAGRSQYQCNIKIPGEHLQFLVLSLRYVTIRFQL